jgi:hypothetical protein
VAQAANRPISSGVAWSTSTAVNGNANRVICEPRLDTAFAHHIFRKSGLFHIFR